MGQAARSKERSPVGSRQLIQAEDEIKSIGQTDTRDWQRLVKIKTNRKVTIHFECLWF